VGGSARLGQACQWITLCKRQSVRFDWNYPAERGGGPNSEEKPIRMLNLNFRGTRERCVCGCMFVPVSRSQSDAFPVLSPSKGLLGSYFLQSILGVFGKIYSDL
jgi:hypothetical protein